MAVNYVRKFQKKVCNNGAYKHILDYAGQTVLHGPKYFLNSGIIEGGKEIKRRTGEQKGIKLKVSFFDRLANYLPLEGPPLPFFLQYCIID